MTKRDRGSTEFSAAGEPKVREAGGVERLGLWIREIEVERSKNWFYCHGVHERGFRALSSFSI